MFVFRLSCSSLHHDLRRRSICSCGSLETAVTSSCTVTSISISGTLTLSALHVLQPLKIYSTVTNALCYQENKRSQKYSRGHKAFVQLRLVAPQYDPTISLNTMPKPYLYLYIPLFSHKHLYHTSVCQFFIRIDQDTSIRVTASYNI